MNSQQNQSQDVMYIVNVTEKSFFKYAKSNEADVGYNKILLELLTPPHPSDKYSHWSRADNIVIAPEHLYQYVEMQYNELRF